MSIAPRITGIYKINKLVQDIPLENIDGSFVNVFDKSFTGNFYSMICQFSNKQIIFSIEIDGTEIFEIDLSNLNEITSQLQNAPYVIHIDQNNSAFIFKPSYPLLVKNNLTLKAKASTNSNSRKFEKLYLEISEE